MMLARIQKFVLCLKKLKCYKEYLLHLKDLVKFKLTSIVKKKVYLAKEKF